MASCAAPSKGRAWTSHAAPPARVLRRVLLRRVLLELRFDVRLGNRTDDLIDDLAALEEQERWNRTNVESRPRLDVGVDVQLRDLHFPFVLRRQLLEDRRDYAARTAPGRPEVHDGKPIVLLDLVLE